MQLRRGPLPDSLPLVGGKLRFHEPKVALKVVLLPHIGNVHAELQVAACGQDGIVALAPGQRVERKVTAAEQAKHGAGRRVQRTERLAYRVRDIEEQRPRGALGQGGRRFDNRFAFGGPRQSRSVGKFCAVVLA